jgi:siroheme synthase
MPGDLGLLQTRLLSSGVLPATPCAIVSEATTAFQKVHITSVANLADSPTLAAPKLLVIGEVVRLADARSLHQQFSQFAFSQDLAAVTSSNSSNPVEDAE